MSRFGDILRFTLAAVVFLAIMALWFGAPVWMILLATFLGKACS